MPPGYPLAFPCKMEHWRPLPYLRENRVYTILHICAPLIHTVVVSLLLRPTPMLGASTHRLSSSLLFQAHEWQVFSKEIHMTSDGMINTGFQVIDNPSSWEDVFSKCLFLPMLFSPYSRLARESLGRWPV